MTLQFHCGPPAGIATTLTARFVRQSHEREFPSDVGHTFMAATTSAVN